MKLKLRAVKIGRRLYKVTYSTTPWTRRNGTISPYFRQMQIAERDCITKRERTLKQQMGTFWHELTHGILIDMNHGLWDNEKFVTRFATRLHRAVDSVRMG